MRRRAWLTTCVAQRKREKGQPGRCAVIPLGTILGIVVSIRVVGCWPDCQAATYHLAGRALRQSRGTFDGTSAHCAPIPLASRHMARNALQYCNVFTKRTENTRCCCCMLRKLGEKTKCSTPGRAPAGNVRNVACRRGRGRTGCVVCASACACACECACACAGACACACVCVRARVCVRVHVHVHVHVPVRVRVRVRVRLCTPAVGMSHLG